MVADPQNNANNGGNNQASNSVSSASSQSQQSSSSGTPLPSIPATAGVGAISITQPPMQSTSYYKIAPSEYITFGWNFTDLYVTPTSLTVSAVCENGNTYPVGPTNGIIPGNAQSVVWYPYGYQTANPSMPLAQASYTLHIWGDSGPSAAAQPGYLSPNSGLEFAMYTPQAYTPIDSGWQCAGCSGSASQYVAHPAFAGLIATILIMFLSGYGTLRRVWN
ncbi:hypothetical protein SERLA73DRAFT_174471 [Serpula lacrymans var. lacrymans S7.3]|uniref:DUF7137 domain-containing protein n=2 Tax=Serpula lacrymans var. lacrymans TaxID=341189 RepID=F8PG20_SERL3|nr:uncharacterized protein SERLADRAFT_456000 [Serpula lacrymans var. lacrymans S7.9]EGO05355.1 hypothetical protein SERLA73DRAFT_174471 [Serpula lacrymans var. lacrymans S7.3]EGO31206.1 hypothetical protein SERLADRAFT_456000 [Serpula lacrymans var. lacrymans S7.9]